MMAKFYSGKIQQKISDRVESCQRREMGGREEKMTRRAYRLSVRLALGQALMDSSPRDHTG